MKPLVSVIIPFFEGISWLEEALESVQKQSYQEYEIILVNDGSKENLDKLKKKFKKLKIINIKNSGPATARNVGIKNSKGKYIAFLDADDFWFEKKLEIQVAFMEKNNIVWSQHSYEAFWENSNRKKIVNTKLFQGDVYLQCFVSFKVQTSCVMVRNNALNEHSILFDKDLRYGQDLAFYKKLAYQYRLGYIDDVLSAFRIRGNNAGFRADIQLKNKSIIWKEIQSNEKLSSILPFKLLLGYKMAYYSNQYLEFLVNKYKKISSKNEYLAKVLYSIPYLLIKTSNVKNKEYKEY